MNDSNDQKDIELEPEIEETGDDIDYEEDNLKDVIKSLKEKIKTLEKEKIDTLTSWQKDKAEFVNARRRDEESKSEFLKFAKQGVIEDLLPTLDSFDMAVNSPVWQSVSPEWKKGMEGIQSLLSSVLNKNDVTAFGAIGDTFDPALHHSIATVATDNKDNEHKVAEILQRGYMMEGRVIRPALVKVFEINS